MVSVNTFIPILISCFFLKNNCFLFGIYKVILLSQMHLLVKVLPPYIV